MEKETIRDLAKSKLSGYIAVVFYLSFLVLTFVNEWIVLLCLVLAIIAAVVKLYYEMKFTIEALKK